MTTPLARFLAEAEARLKEGKRLQFSEGQTAIVLLAAFAAVVERARLVASDGERHSERAMLVSSFLLMHLRDDIKAADAALAALGEEKA